MKTKEACFMYRCRLCGKKFPNIYSGENSAFNHLLYAIHKMVVNNQTPIAMIVIHSCNKKSSGVADLIGYEIK